MSADLEVSRVDGYGWSAIYDALTMAITGMNGIVCELRCERDDGQALSSAGE